MSHADVVATGTEPVDERIGGVPARRITLVSGAPGAGRTCFALAYVVAALRRGEAACLVTTDAPEAVLEFGKGFLRVDLAPFLRSRRLTILTYGAGFDAKIRALGHIDKPLAELSRLASERAWKHVVFDTIDPVLVAAEPSRLKQFITAVTRAIGKLGLTCLCTVTDSTALKLATDEFASHVACSLALIREGAQRLLRFQEAHHGGRTRSWTGSMREPMALPTWPIAFHFVPGVGIVSSARLHEATMPEVPAVKKPTPPAAPVAQPTTAPLGVVAAVAPVAEAEPSGPISQTAPTKERPILYIEPTKQFTVEDLKSTQQMSVAEILDSLGVDFPADATAMTSLPEIAQAMEIAEAPVSRDAAAQKAPRKASGG